ncbi:yteA family sporulation protein [Anoxybacillus suryakundensis]|uniref:Transcriptional regulator, TraR/DksA family n=1 Tax=Anoxybacillus suryakundensis TaxID=1325335 RepID=A0A0K6GS00_9BACL|nr:yteA family sporulation protein [Anoxybacillus suryakundensis]CUA81301.1 transcriptional regulator, TraR/DksA family [Anoxybacillus suryakundensis]
MVNLSDLRERLLQEKQQIMQRLKQNDHFGLTRTSAHDSVGELSNYDNHPADSGTELYEREKDIALNEHTEKELHDIERALQAMEHGTYGICQICGEAIPLERLEAIPTTMFCKQHSADQVVSQQRPIEESVLSPPFGEFVVHEDIETFDAEDSWQKVARFGTSETPSDVQEDTVHYDRMYIDAGEQIGYVEPLETFAATDLYGTGITIYPNIIHEQYEQMLDDGQLMSPLGDLPAYEKDPYTS